MWKVAYIFIIGPAGKLLPGIYVSDKEDLANGFCTWTKSMTNHAKVLVCQVNGSKSEFCFKNSFYRRG